MRRSNYWNVRPFVCLVWFAAALCFSGSRLDALRNRGLQGGLRESKLFLRQALPKLDSLALSQARVVREADSETLVCLVGCMHFNPLSTFCAKTLAQELVDANVLAAVVLEMFDGRWQRMYLADLL